MSINLEVVNSADSLCDEFVGKMPQGRIAHLSTWSNAVVQAVGLKNFYIAAKDEQGVCGVLPLMQAKSKFFGNFMVSQAFSDYGGPLTDDPKVLEAMFNRAIELAIEQDSESIEFRNIQPLNYDLQLRTGKMVMYLQLDSDPEKIWKSFKPKVRNQVRKAEKSGIYATDGYFELLNVFYSVYTNRMRQLGTPCYPKRLMYSLLKAFPDNSRLFIVRLENTTVGGGLTFFFNDLVEIPFASTLTQYNSLCPNNLLYWTIIKYYCLAGAKRFDFGRCTVDSPTYRFKKQWGPEPVDLHYQYWVRPGHDFSILSPDNPKYQRRIQIWRKLPLWLTRLAGPYISRNLP